MRRLRAFRIAFVAASIAALSAAALPRTGPIPEPKPEEAQESPASPAIPVPEPKPPTPEAAAPAQSQTPAPSQTEQQTPSGNTTTAPSAEAPATPDNSPVAHATGPDGKPLEEPLTIAPETEEDHQACMKDLQAMGAVFQDIPRIDDGDGCGIDKPIKLAEALPGVKFKPEGTMRCQAALALSHWMRESVIPAGQVALKDAGPIVTINQASTYICRLRNSAETGKISEHARGNAIDIASFTFKDGTTVAVQPRREDSTLTGAFQRAVSATGCLYFTTVLDPESDAAHENHFHMDVLERHGGFRYCH